MRRLAMLIALVGVLATASILIFLRNGEAPAIGVTTNATGVSPIFGVNMSLFDGSDELATNPTTQAMFRSWGVPLIRLPLRAGLSDAVLTTAMKAVLAIGATPMVVLHGPTSGTVADDQHLLSLVTAVFGDRTVYLEYGNEADLAGVNASAYTAGWNSVVPALKAAAPGSYRFVGPVNFQADPAYAASFAAAARPAPDYLSWHEYVCDATKPDSYCTDHLANWASHASAVEDAVRGATGHTIPFFISEWNLDPDDTPRYADVSFIQPWTRAALTELLDLIPLGLAGAMIYTATNHGDFGLVDNGSPTAQGSVFRDVLAASAQVAPSASADPSASGAGGPSSGVPGGSSGGSSGGGTGGGASGGGSGGTSGGSGGHGSSGGGASSGGGGSGSGTSSGGGAATGGGGAAANGTVHVGFEDGSDGWGKYWGYDSMSVAQTSAVHYDGGHALKVTATSTDYVAVGTDDGLGALHKGSTVTMHVYASGGAGTIRPFTMNPSSTVYFAQGESALPRSAGWFTVTFSVPSAVSTVHAIGLQLHSSASSNWIAIDDVTWAG